MEVAALEQRKAVLAAAAKIADCGGRPCIAVDPKPSGYYTPVTNQPLSYVQ